ncbi:hypothetical protein AN1V17_15380 [Vallitalea sediminicola]
MLDLDYLFDLCIITSIKGIVLILIILLLQHFFRRNFTARWVYTLWSLVIIRLLIPTSPLENVLSLYNMGIVKRLSFNMNDLILGRLGTSYDSFEFIGNNININSFVNNAFSIDWKHLFAIIWIIGILFFLSIFIYININILILFKNSNVCTDKNILDIMNKCSEQINVTKNIRLYISSNLSSPMTYGVIFPKIIIPKDVIANLDYKELRYIFLHELVHIKRYDVLFNILGMLVCILHWFNPLVWYVFFRSKKDCELACDESVLQYLSSQEYTNYGLTLIQILELTISTKVTNTIVAKALINDRSEANARISQITNYNKKSKSVIIFSVILIIIIALIGLNEDTSTRPALSHNKHNVYGYLGVSEHNIRTSFGIKPVHTFLLKTNNIPYYVLYYNVLGEKVEFWFDGTDGDGTSRKALEITTTEYKGIIQGMPADKAIKIAQTNDMKLINKESSNSFTKYFYQDTKCNIMILIDSDKGKVYSLTLY